jgi:predicted amidophosphoribosyltransferase
VRQWCDVKVQLREIAGPWDAGWVLDKHTVRSTYTGDDSQGRPQFDTLRTEVGEAMFLLKYRSRWDQVSILAQALFDHIWPRLGGIGYIIPMPASNQRARQPVHEIARGLGQLTNTPVFENLLLRSATDRPLKDMVSKDEKVAALNGRFSIHDEIKNNGQWNVLLLDDLFDTGASMEEAAKALRTYAKAQRIYVAALTWK